MLLFKGWLNLEFCAASALWKACTFLVSCCFTCTSSAMHPAALNLLLQVTIACLHWPDRVSGGRTAKAPGTSYFFLVWSSLDHSSVSRQGCMYSAVAAAGMKEYREAFGKHWNKQRACVFYRSVTFCWSATNFHGNHSAAIWNDNCGLAEKTNRSLKDQSGTPKINEKSWSLSFSCERLWAGRPNLDQSIKWSVDISLSTSASSSSALYPSGTWKCHLMSTGPLLLYIKCLPSLKLMSKAQMFEKF